MTKIPSSPALNAVGAPEGDTPVRASYEAPRMVRVRVATAILNAGKITASQNCTRHWHDDLSTCAE